VHIGQQDMDYQLARKLLGPGALIGLSIETIEQARAAAAFDVDYLGVGPVFATATKMDAAPPLGVVGLARVRALAPHPIVAIGGIGTENVGQVIHSGADGVAIVRPFARRMTPSGPPGSFAIDRRGARQGYNFRMTGTGTRPVRPHGKALYCVTGRFALSAKYPTALRDATREAYNVRIQSDS